MNDAEDGPAGVDDGDIDGEFSVALDKFLGSVERIDEPERGVADVRRVAGGECFLADDRVLVGDAHLDGALDQFLGRLVGFRHRRGIGFFLNLEIGLVDFHDFLAGPSGDVANLFQ